MGISSFLRFFYHAFIRFPLSKAARHARHLNTNDQPEASVPEQQEALERFYKGQADVYDATRGFLLRGREEMLARAAEQLKQRERVVKAARMEKDGNDKTPAWKPVWIDVGGGTGANVEAMQSHINVPEYFSRVIIIDLSPSLLEVARKRFDRLGWSNILQVCQDVHDLPNITDDSARDALSNSHAGETVQADLITMSYALTMIPSFHPVIDALQSMLRRPTGIIAVVDFYVQSEREYAGRNYIGDTTNRHVNALSRAVWRAWYEIDRVWIGAARRDYLEYRFGTVNVWNRRNWYAAGVPYYIWIGCDRGGVIVEEELKSDERVIDRVKGMEDGSALYKLCLESVRRRVPLPSRLYQDDIWKAESGEA